MGLTYGFYDSLRSAEHPEGDRRYTAIQWSSIFDGIILDGVFATVGEAFRPHATGNDMSVTIGAGRAWFDHTWTYIDGNINDPYILTWSGDLLPEPAHSRTDTIILEVNTHPDYRSNDIKILKGNSQTGNPTALTKSEYLNQYALAYVTLPANASVIRPGNIEYAVGVALHGQQLTPLVTGLLQMINAENWIASWRSTFFEWMEDNDLDFNEWRDTEETIFAGWREDQKTAFTEWFASLQEWLTPEEAANLAAQILRIQRKLYATFYAADWNAEADGTYTQTVEIMGMTENDYPVLTSDLAVDATPEEQQAYKKAFSILTSGIGTTATNSVTMRVFKLPATDISVMFKGA